MDEKQLCRCCLRAAPDKDLTTPYIFLGKTEIYSHMLKECFDLHLSMDDGECGICWVCVDRLRDACDFKLQVFRSQVKLQKQLTREETGNGKAVEPVESKVPDDDFTDEAMPDASPVIPVAESRLTDDGDIKAEPVPDVLSNRGVVPPDAVTPNADEDGIDDTLLDASDVEDRENIETVNIDDNDEDPSPETSKDDVACDEDLPAHPEKVEPAQPVSTHGKQQLTVGCAVRLERLRSDEAPHASHASVETSHHEPRRASRVEEVPGNTPATRFEEQTYTCDTCGTQFTEKSSLIRHIQNHSLQTDNICVMYCCPICLKKFPCKTLIANHVHTTEREIFICDTCNRHFSEKSVLIRHIFAHNNGYLCKICYKTFKHNCLLIRHRKTYHVGKVTYRCDMCDQQFDKRAKLKIHKRIHDKEKPHCKECNKYFADRRILNKHQITHNAAKPFMCEVCFHKFTKRNSLIKHRRIHTGEKPFKCEICNKSFSLKSALTRHKKMHNRLLTCEVCNENFSERSHLVEHKKIHVREKAYRCQDCNQQFSSKRGLQYHKIRHSENKPYTCDLCKVSFRRKHNLDQHNKKHAEKIYSCSFCDKKFTHKHQLEAHERTHTGAKPFICDQCGAQFSQNYILEKHKRKHTDTCDY